MNLIPPTKNAAKPKGAPAEQPKTITFSAFVDLLIQRVGKIQEGAAGLQKDLFIARDLAANQADTIVNIQGKLAELEKQFADLKPKGKIEGKSKV
jgi:hypothetical protein